MSGIEGSFSASAGAASSKPLERPTEADTVTKAVLARHSTRVFQERAVPASLVEEALQLAQLAPSSTNIQPWRLNFAAGAPLQRLGAALTAAFDRGDELRLAAIPDAYNHYRSALGETVYGPDGLNIARGDTQATMAAVRRNFSFYGAPLVAAVAIDGDLNDVDVLSVGLYLQTLLLLLTERGLATQVSASPAGYSDIIREHLGIGGNMKILCTLAIGYEDDGAQINKLQMPREDWRNSVRFLTE
jgi:nitroreductase